MRQRRVSSSAVCSYGFGRNIAASYQENLERARAQNENMICRRVRTRISADAGLVEDGRGYLREWLPALLNRASCDFGACLNPVSCHLLEFFCQNDVRSGRHERPDGSGNAFERGTPYPGTDPLPESETAFGRSFLLEYIFALRALVRRTQGCRPRLRADERFAGGFAGRGYECLFRAGARCWCWVSRFCFSRSFSLRCFKICKS